MKQVNIIAHRFSGGLKLHVFIIYTTVVQKSNRVEKGKTERKEETSQKSNKEKSKLKGSEGEKEELKGAKQERGRRCSLN